MIIPAMVEGDVWIGGRFAIYLLSSGLCKCLRLCVRLCLPLCHSVSLSVLPARVCTQDFEDLFEAHYIQFNK